MINSDKIKEWKTDVERSVQQYNAWFLNTAPLAFRNERKAAVSWVDQLFGGTKCLSALNKDFIRSHPELVSILRMCTAPPIARDRLSGLSGVSKGLINSMESGKKSKISDDELDSVLSVINQLLDVDLFENIAKDKQLLERAKVVIADRATGAQTNPIIRNAQEERQLQIISKWLNKAGYKKVSFQDHEDIFKLPSKSFAYHVNVPTKKEGAASINVSVDVAIQKKQGSLPYLIEAKSAGDYTNTNKRRKEEAQKMSQLKKSYGNDVRYILFLCGYFDAGYLGYEASEGIDWIWEHRVSDFELLLSE